MRIVVVTNYYPPAERGGYELTCAAFVNYLRGDGHLVKVLTSTARPVHPGPHATDTDVERVFSLRPPEHALGGLAGLRADCADVRRLRRVLRDFAPEALSLWGMSRLSRAIVAAALYSGIPLSARVSDEWPIRILESRRPAGLRGAVGQAARRTLGVSLEPCLSERVRWVFSSRFMQSQTIEAGLPASAPMAVVHSGIDLRSLTYKGDEPWHGRGLYLGRLEAYKGVDTAVRAAAICHTPMRLRIVGHGPPEYVALLRELREELGVSDSIELCPPVDHGALDAAFRETDVLLFPARWKEPWGRVPLEAMAAGVLVIASGTGGSGEYLEDRGNALVVAPEDVSGWADGIDELAGDPGLRSRLRARGLETARRHSAESTNAALWRECIESVR